MKSLTKTDIGYLIDLVDADVSKIKESSKTDGPFPLNLLSVDHIREKLIELKKEAPESNVPR